MNFLMVGAIAALIVVGCSAQPLKPYSDPYLEAFQGSEVDYVLCMDKDGRSIDTLFLNDDGTLIRTNGPYGAFRYDYDDLNFITRKLESTDIDNNYLIKYFRESDTQLRQVWLTLKHLKWEYSEKDIKDTMSIVEFELDKFGRISVEHDRRSQERTEFLYNESGQLVRKNLFFTPTGKPGPWWEYEYKENKIYRILFHVGEKVMIEHKYNLGKIEVSNEQGILTYYKHIKH